MVNYADGKIYQIINTKNDKMYVGSTCQNLTRRMNDHRSSSKTENSKFYTAMTELGADTFHICLYKNFPCQTKSELEAEEFKIMKEHQASGIALYNDFIGTMSTEQREKFLGEQNSQFQYGCIQLESRYNRFRFRWSENGIDKSSSFSCTKYGVLGALQKVQDARKCKYPNWKTPEEETLSELCAIEC